MWCLKLWCFVRLYTNIHIWSLQLSRSSIIPPLSYINCTHEVKVETMYLLSQCNLTSEATVKLIPNFRHKLTDDWCVKFDKTVCLLNCYSINFNHTQNARKCDDFITVLFLTFYFEIIASSRFAYVQ